MATTGGKLDLKKPSLTNNWMEMIGTDLPENFQKIDDEVSTHLADYASQTELGHIKIGAGGSIEAGGFYVPTGFAYGDFARDMSLADSDQFIETLFKPRAILVMSCVFDQPNHFSIGFTDGNGRVGRCITDGHKLSTPHWKREYALVSIIQNDSNIYRGVLKSITDTGFTISWTRTGTPTGLIHMIYLLYK